MTSPEERNLGRQPIDELMTSIGLRPHDLVSASTEQITHKMVARACKGLRLTPGVKMKIVRAFNAASQTSRSEAELFNY
jgi:hypothetical protein